jgi:hypothetical protein
MRIVLGLALLTAAAATFPTAAVAAGNTSCDVHGSRTVDATRSVRVFKREGQLFACAFRTGRPIRLGDAYECESSSCSGGGVARGIAGRFVAVVYFAGSVNRPFDGEPRAALQVTDTVARKRRLVYATNLDSQAPPHESGTVNSVRISASGRGAFISEFRPPLGTDGFVRQVRVFGLSDQSIIDTGSGIDPFSLAIAGRSVYWKRYGEARTADLPD